MIRLKNIDETADKVVHRTIPAPNGDCKLIAYPGDAFFADYNMTITGLPSAIACGLSGAINVDGVAVPLEPGDKPSLGAEPTQATDNQGGAFVAPPPPSPFKPLEPADYACIHKHDKGPFCLPPGTYHKQGNLGFNIKEVDTLTLPPGWSMSTRTKDRFVPHQREDRYSENVFAQNQYHYKPSNELKTFNNVIENLDLNRDDEATFTFIAPQGNDGPNPVCCLFTKANFGGNVWCVGEGGGDVLPQWKNKAKSVSCHGGGHFWLYADKYGDAGAALVRGNVEDLKSEPYGNKKGTFEGKVKAVWVLKG